MQFSRYHGLQIFRFVVPDFSGKSNGDKGIRTLDPLLARQVLSQLSYTPLYPAATCSPMPSPA